MIGNMRELNVKLSRDLVLIKTSMWNTSDTMKIAVTEKEKVCLSTTLQSNMMGNWYRLITSPLT